MKLHRAVLLGTWSLVAANLLLAFAAISLLTRMSPAIATIIERNDVSLEASEQMLAVLATPPAKVPEAERRERFEAALARAERNVTEPAESDVLREIRGGLDRALDGDADGMVLQIAAIRRLASINREAMRGADDDAMALGTAGAWAVALLALVSFTISLVFIRQLNVALLRPLEELQSTLRAARRGDIHRRATTAHAPRDLRATMEDANALLDQLQAARPRPVT